ncbi:MAG: hypothetical protein KAJ55_00380 [Anaerolineales bacterium]|nr:hypothetical protein [Anaerolineales bacterium]
MSWLSQGKNWLLDKGAQAMGTASGNPTFRRKGEPIPGFDPDDAAAWGEEVSDYKKGNTMLPPQFGIGSPWDRDPRMQGIDYSSLLSGGYESGPGKPTFAKLPDKPKSGMPSGKPWGMPASEPAGTDWQKWLGLGLQGAGVAAGIYGDYQQGKTIDRELKHRRKLEMEDREREMRTGRALQPFLQRYLSEGG